MSPAPNMSPDVNPGRLRDFHNRMLALRQDEERARSVARREAKDEHAQRKRAELRAAWLEHHQRLHELHAGLAREHGERARALANKGGN